jgi:hypothetical protein
LCYNSVSTGITSVIPINKGIKQLIFCTGPG